MVHVFLSFVEEDLNVVNLFRGQAKNEHSDLEFADYSIKAPFDSTNSDYIARGITDQLRLVSVTVCLYGPTTYTSKWECALGSAGAEITECTKPITSPCPGGARPCDNAMAWRQPAPQRVDVLRHHCRIICPPDGTSNEPLAG